MPLLAAALLLAQAPTLHVPAIFADNMVLQRNQPLPFFGTAQPGTHIDVTLNGHHAYTNAKRDGTWMVKLRPMDAGGPYTATITGDGTITLRNVMVGEVWLCSGQSNMEMRVGEARESQVAQSLADPDIRMFTVQHLSSEIPAPDVTGSWVTSSGDSVVNFSAVAYWYAVELHKKLGVPIGLIHSSWGGTPIEAWTSRHAYNVKPTLAPIVKNYLAGLHDFPERKAEYDRKLADWKESVYHTDTGNDGFGMRYPEPDCDTTSWRQVTLPNLLEVTENRQMDGAVWYRKTIDVPAEWAGKPLRLVLGTIKDFDITYFNGRRIGAIDDRTPYWYAVDRVYPVPPALVHAGANTIAVRIFNQFGPGGFTGGANQLKIAPADGSGEPIFLEGAWLSKVERYIEPATEEVVNSKPQPPFGPGHPWAPGGLYNGMIDPLIPYAIKGVLWYQGEANVNYAYQYRELFPTLIEDWRRRWEEGDMPFYFVQLAGYTERLNDPVESNWAELREAQAKALALPNTGMATAVDIGEANDIHPKNKREVGRRLALIALARDYGQKVIYTGPTMREVKFEGSEAHIQYDNVADGLKSVDGSALGAFTIAGEDHKFYWGVAKLVGNTVVVSNPYVPKPVAVRYAWANNPYVNLANSEGLPALPFRTDDWPGITSGAR
ncbi:sialate O-acetylesterase [Fimbriimonas ginsengisoli]|uniref:Sialic acid-specific 9-O-acetylesterase n=1 Tax=Fimbriimonas ginsengisoli Gsoil 348 TaxID=661478 RepID=A0A068NWA0_FIMGI|nr:sialate O-acetylesterase [Fimbriimonas ginsengisoli]AIE87808.1 Sialic acid-specific 9-O-acetylesterase [Fimbriimonas ginsengisoli Gsoil 348]